MMSEQDQFQALNTIDMIRDLFTGAGKETFTRAEILNLLQNLKGESAIFDPLVVIAQALVAEQVDAVFDAAHADPIPGLVN